MLMRKHSCVKGGIKHLNEASVRCFCVQKAIMMLYLEKKIHKNQISIRIIYEKDTIKENKIWTIPSS